MDRDDYEAMMCSVMGTASAADLDTAGRRRLIEHLRARLPKPPAGHGSAPHNLGTKPMLRKIEALLADAGRPWDYAEAMARRICQRERIAFCSDAELRKLIAALTYDQQRRARRAAEPDHA